MEDMGIMIFKRSDRYTSAIIENHIGFLNECQIINQRQDDL